MRNKVFLFLLTACSLMAGCSKSPEFAAPDKKDEEAKSTHRNEAGEAVVVADENTQTRIGLKAETLEAASLNPEIKGYGQVLDPGPLAALVSELATAQTAASVSTQEFERLKTLSAQTNTSVRALQAAEAMARHDQLAMVSLRQRLLVEWGPAVGNRSDLPEFAQALVAGGPALVRIELPAGESLKTPPANVRLARIGEEQSSLQARLVGAAPQVAPQTQGQRLFYLVEPNEPRLAPGAAVTAWLQTGGEALSGAIVPRDAVVRSAGAAWVYIQTAAGEFTRRRISTANPTETGWFVRESAAAGDKIVVVGAQLLLSEEMKAQAWE